MRDRRLFSTEVHSPLQRSEFYNRKKELEALEQVVTGKPQISVISGPINSGKTTLILHLLERLSETHPILHLDLRDRSFSNIEELNNSLQVSMISWLETCKKIFETNIRLNKKDHSKKPPIEGLNDFIRNNI